MNLVGFASLLSALSAPDGDTPFRPKLPDSPFFWMPNSASTFAADTDFAFDFLMWISVASSVAILGAMAYFVMKYRAPARSANHKAETQKDHDNVLEATWTLIPLVSIIPLFVWGFQGYLDLRTPPKDSYDIRATGQKWKWLFDYPNGYTDDALHVPVNRNVRIVIEAVDVLHSLFLPSFRAKMDAVPGRYTELWFKATEVGTFPIYCAEYCGTHHSDMLSQVIVHEEGGYERWLEEAEKKMLDLPLPELGALLYTKQGCTACHSTDGSPRVGPSFKGIWGKNESLADGSTVTVDENYVKESLFEPQAKIVKTFAPAMPTFKGKLKDREIDGIIAFLKSLK